MTRFIAKQLHYGITERLSIGVLPVCKPALHPAGELGRNSDDRPQLLNARDATLLQRAGSFAAASSRRYLSAAAVLLFSRPGRMRPGLR